MQLALRKGLVINASTTKQEICHGRIPVALVVQVVVLPGLQSIKTLTSIGAELIVDVVEDTLWAWVLGYQYSLAFATIITSGPRK